jgi:hypothetical protein
MALRALLSLLSLCTASVRVVGEDIASKARARFGIKGENFNVDGYDKYGYDVLGFDTEGYDTLGRPVTDEFAGTASSGM